ncbi:50S ribosomal protein 6 [Morus notabilis]|uniref:50S ribosomal protein 6 n=1 Tax=Morus notabilis TaxID=981085 RepID=W9SDC9_9ROSA|nr:50S ribosomal protein 6, chloroplastic [Morus notabilis]EXC01136.1 50S ribosomal protein 6 [Morus notabilis]
MSTAAFFGAQIVAVRIPSAPASFAGARKSAPWNGGGGGGPAVIECSSRPTKKATAHHMKTRPKKTQAWDIRRKPTVYAPLPPLPPDWVLAGSDDSSSDSIPSSSSSPVESPPAVS